MAQFIKHIGEDCCKSYSSASSDSCKVMSEIEFLK